MNFTFLKTNSKFTSRLANYGTNGLLLLTTKFSTTRSLQKMSLTRQINCDKNTYQVHNMYLRFVFIEIWLILVKSGFKTK